MTAFLRMFRQDQNIESAFECLIEAQPPTFPAPVLVGHSNGADVICGMLTNHHELRVDEIHLIAAATDSSYEKNGLNAAVDRGQVGRIFLYCSEDDGALEAARGTSFIGKIIKGLAFGYLGLTGGKGMSQEANARTSTIWRDGFGHSTWFQPDQFGQTMRLITTTP